MPTQFSTDRTRKAYSALLASTAPPANNPPLTVGRPFSQSVTAAMLCAAATGAPFLQQTTCRPAGRSPDVHSTTPARSTRVCQAKPSQAEPTPHTYVLYCLQ